MSEIPKFPEAGYVRLPTVLPIISLSKSTWRAGIRTGRFPAPIRSGRITMSSVQSIRDLIDQIEKEG